MSRSVLRVALAVLAAVLVSAIAWLVYDRTVFEGAVRILVPLGATTAVLAELIASHRERIGGLRRQMGVLAGLTALQLAAAVTLFAEFMFVSEQDALLVALVAGYAGMIGLMAARLVSHRALRDLDAVRRALTEVGEGSRDVRIGMRGRDELGTLAADVEAMVAKLASEERARRDLIAGVSHDLRTPITTIQLITQGLEDGIFERELARERLGLISTQVGALAALVNDLFELTRLQAGELSWSVEQVRLDELLHETVGAMRPHAAAEGVLVRAELAEELIPVRGNPGQLQRVLFNLIQNSIRHTPADGSVVVRAQRVAGPAVEIEVADTGEGIDLADRQRIFEPFIQGAAREARTDGSVGLGLAIARAIVEAHGGRIWLGEASIGTRVRFNLPAT